MIDDKRKLAGLSRGRPRRGGQGSRRSRAQGQMGAAAAEHHPAAAARLAERPRHPPGAVRSELEPHPARRQANDTRALIAEIAAAARRKGQAARLCRLRQLHHVRPDGQEPGHRDGLHAEHGPRARRAQQRKEAADLNALIKRSGGKFIGPAVGLGFLRRKAAQGEATPSTSPGEALFRDHQRAGKRRVLCREPALRADLQKAQRHAGLSPRRHGLHRLRCGRQRTGAVLFRSVEARQQAGRRVDVELRRPVAPVRAEAGGVQRPEFAQARAGPAGADQLRRCQHHVPRIWPCAARDAVEPDAIPSSRAPAPRAILSSSPASSTRTG